MPSVLLLLVPAPALPPLLTSSGTTGQHPGEREAGKCHVLSKVLADGHLYNLERKNLMLFWSWVIHPGLTTKNTAFTLVLDEGCSIMWILTGML